MFAPALNEELAATAVAGTQLLAEVPGHDHDGVVGFWYGKNPGLDRAADAIRHGNHAGTAPLGGAVALIGDDPTCKSSTLPSSSVSMAQSLSMPLLSAVVGRRRGAPGPPRRRPLPLLGAVGRPADRRRRGRRDRGGRPRRGPGRDPRSRPHARRPASRCWSGPTPSKPRSDLVGVRPAPGTGVRPADVAERRHRRPTPGPPGHRGRRPHLRRHRAGARGDGHRRRCLRPATQCGSSGSPCPGRSTQPSSAG